MSSSLSALPLPIAPSNFFQFGHDVIYSFLFIGFAVLLGVSVNNGCQQIKELHLL